MDQAGTPEGDLCAHMANLIADVIGTFDDDIDIHWREIRWKTSHERELLVQVGKFVGVPAMKETSSRKRVSIFETDARTFAAIEHAFCPLRPRLAAVLEYACLGFNMGALPLPPVEDEDEDESEDKMDPDLKAIAIAALFTGRSNQPRAALPSAVDGDR